METFAPCPAPFNMAAHVLQWAQRTPDKVALEVLSDPVERWTYGALEERVLNVGAGLLGAGIAPGEIIFLRLGNVMETPLTYLAAIAVGIVPVPVSAQLTQRELLKVIERLRPAALFTDEPLNAPDLRLFTPSDMPGLIADTRADYAMGDPNRLAYIVFTSGTSGTPRAVQHAHRAVWARQMMIRDWERIGPEDRLLHGGDFNWTYTMGTGLMDPWAAGATALIKPAGTPVDALPGLLADHGATVLATDPGVLRRLCRNTLPPMPTLRHSLTAGWALPETVRESWRVATGTDVYEAFGQSEVSTFLSEGPGRGLAPQRGRRVAILDEAGDLVAQGQTGALAIHRTDPGLTLGYAGDEAAVAERIRGEWFLTGDLFRQDESGTYRFAGRNDEIINPGGFRVSPIEVEDALSTFPGITELAVIEHRPKPDTTIAACAYVSADAIDEAALAAHAEANLARYKQPRLYVRLDALPRNANGKLIRKALPALVTAATSDP